MWISFKKRIKFGQRLKAFISKMKLKRDAARKDALATKINAPLPGTQVYDQIRSSVRKPRSSRRHHQKLLKQASEARTERDKAQLEVDIAKIKPEVIKSVHKECADEIRWHERAGIKPPFLPGKKGPYQLDFEQTSQSYHPGFIDRLLKRVERKKQLLKEGEQRAAQKDQRLFQKWEEAADFALRVTVGDQEAYRDVLEKEGPFDEIKQLGSAIEVHVIDRDTIELTIHAHLAKVIPTETKSLRADGKAAKRKMDKSDYDRLCADYLCSCVIRAAREVLALLPISAVYVHALGKQPGTSNDDEGMLSSVKIDRKSAQKINFNFIDCTDAIKHFQHNMVFRKIEGFAFVDKIYP